MKNRYLIGNAHLDPVWQWTYDEGLSLVKSTFRSALERMKEFPDYKFTSACAFYYKYVKETEPEMFEEIKARVKEGRWGVVGGMWIQPDCNIPSGEAFCRHLLYSQRFNMDNFGFIAKTGYNVDSFGHNVMLPQLLKKAGMDNYIYMRPNDDNEKPNLPKENLHEWVSPDGSKVDTFRVLYGYNSDLNENYIALINKRTQPQMLFYGIGNHGGGPSIENLKRAEKLILEGDYKYALPDEYFFDMKDIKKPIITEDLQHHASGCYSANSKVKKANREAENKLVRAEKADVLAGLLTGSNPHNEEITKAWEKVMFNQFHDILAGCAIREAYVDALNSFGYASSTAKQIETYALQRISWRIKTTDVPEKLTSEMWDRLWVKEGEGAPVVVFNPHSFPVKATGEFGCQNISRVVDNEGNDVPFQLVRASYMDGQTNKKCVFECEIGAFGYKLFYLYRSIDNSKPEKDFADSSFIATENSLENKFVKVVFDVNSGAIKSYIDKKTGIEYSNGLLGQIKVCEDIDHDTWAHDVFSFNKDLGEFSNGTIRVVEDGVLVKKIMTTVTYKDSKCVRYYTLFRDGKNVKVDTVLTFNEEYKLAKVCFDVNIEKPKVTYSAPYGFITKECNGEEEPTQSFVDIHDETGKGISVLNDCKYSACAINNQLRFIAARTCAFLDHYGRVHRNDETRFIDIGEQDFSYEIMIHDKECMEDIAKTADVLNAPFITVEETHHDGTLPPKYSGISVDKENVIVKALKTPCEGKGVVMRIVEVGGKRTSATIDFVPYNVNISIELNPQEIKTIRLLPTGKYEEILITEF